MAQFSETLQEISEDVKSVTMKKQETENRITAMAEDLKKGHETLLDIRESLATSVVFRRNIDDNIKYVTYDGAVHFWAHPADLHAQIPQANSRDRRLREEDQTKTRCSTTGENRSNWIWYGPIGQHMWAKKASGTLNFKNVEWSSLIVVKW